MPDYIYKRTVRVYRNVAFRESECSVANVYEPETNACDGLEPIQESVTMSDKHLIVVTLWRGLSHFSRRL